MKAKDLKPAVDAWLYKQEYEEEKAKNTIKQYTRTLTVFMDFIEAQELEEIDKKAVIAFKEWMKEEMEYNRKHPKPGRTQVKSMTTINTRITTVNKFFKENGEPELAVKLEKEDPVKNDVLTENEYNRLLEWADKLDKPRIKLIMETLAGTGIRISELYGITVESLKTRTNKVTNKGRERTIFIPKQLAKKLKAYCEENNIKEGIIFHGADNDRVLDQANIRKEMKSVAGKARGIKLDKVHPHNFRHIFARRYANMPNPNPYILPIILGHSISSLPVTFRYTQPTQKELLTVVDEIEAYYSKPKKTKKEKK